MTHAFVCVMPSLLHPRPLPRPSSSERAEGTGRCAQTCTLRRLASFALPRSLSLSLVHLGTWKGWHDARNRARCAISSLFTPSPCPCPSPLTSSKCAEETEQHARLHASCCLTPILALALTLIHSLSARKRRHNSCKRARVVSSGSHSRPRPHPRPPPQLRVGDE